METDKDPEFPREEEEAAFHPRPTWLENGCMVICEVAIVAMAAIVLLELITRNLFGFSFEISEELGGYMVAGIAFLSLPVCQVHRSYHHVLFVQHRLSPRARAASHVVFDLLSLGFCVILVWQLTRLVLDSYHTQDVAMTLLATPLWIPQAAMPLGAAIATISLLRSLMGNIRRFRAMGR